MTCKQELFYAFHIDLFNIVLFSGCFFLLFSLRLHSPAVLHSMSCCSFFAPYMNSYANVFDCASWNQDYQRFIWMFCICWLWIVFITLATRWKMSENTHSSICRGDIKYEQFNALTQYTSQVHQIVNGKWESKKAKGKQIIHLCCSFVNTYNTRIKWHNGLLVVGCWISLHGTIEWKMK